MKYEEMSCPWCGHDLPDCIAATDVLAEDDGRLGIWLKWQCPECSTIWESEAVTEEVGERVDVRPWGLAQSTEGAAS